MASVRYKRPTLPRIEGFVPGLPRLPRLPLPDITSKAVSIKQITPNSASKEVDLIMKIKGLTQSDVIHGVINNQNWKKGIETLKNSEEFSTHMFQENVNNRIEFLESVEKIVQEKAIVERSMSKNISVPLANITDKPEDDDRNEVIKYLRCKGKWNPIQPIYQVQPKHFKCFKLQGKNTLSAIVTIWGVGDTVPETIQLDEETNTLYYEYPYYTNGIITDSWGAFTNTFRVSAEMKTAPVGHKQKMLKFANVLKDLIQKAKVQDILIRCHSHGCLITYGAILQLKMQGVDLKGIAIIAIAPPKYLPQDLVPRGCVNIYHESDLYYKYVYNIWKFKRPNFNSVQAVTKGDTICVDNSVLIKNTSTDFRMAQLYLYGCCETDYLSELQTLQVHSYHVSYCHMFPVFLMDDMFYMVRKFDFDTKHNPIQKTIGDMTMTLWQTPVMTGAKQGRASPLPTKKRVTINGRTHVVYKYSRGTREYIKVRGKGFLMLPIK